ncbi:MAG: transposase [Patescibacteria group bacterium]
MKLHHNSQKHFDFNDRIYFISTKTKENFPYFNTEIYSKILINVIWNSQKLKKFYIYGYIIMPNHLHIMIEPMNYSISKILQSIKLNSSMDINKLIKYNFNNQYYNVEGGKSIFRLPKRKFAWQLGFHDHLIRSQNDFLNHINYIKNNPIHHGIKIPNINLFINNPLPIK